MCALVVGAVAGRAGRTEKKWASFSSAQMAWCQTGLFRTRCAPCLTTGASIGTYSWGLHMNPPPAGKVHKQTHNVVEELRATTAYLVLSTVIPQLRLYKLEPWLWVMLPVTSHYLPIRTKILLPLRTTASPGLTPLIHLVADEQNGGSNQLGKLIQNLITRGMHFKVNTHITIVFPGL